MLFESDFIIYALVFLLGLVLASYLNSWMWRVKNGKYKWGGRSMCVHCSRLLTTVENIPLFSYMVLQGRCRTCRGVIPPDYFWMELLLPVVLVGLTYFNLHQPMFSGWYFFRDFFFVALLTVIFVYDWKYYLILPSLTAAGTIVAIMFNIFVIGDSWHWIIGMLIGGGFFGVQYVISHGRWIGDGDIYLGIMMGALLGWPVIIVALLLAYTSGALVGVGLLAASKKGLRSEMPFGTFLAVGTLVALLWGDRMVNWYVGLVGW